MTQSELADKCGVKFSAIHKYESGIVVNLKQTTIAALADALNVKPSYLLCLDDEPERNNIITEITDRLSALTPEQQEQVLRFAEFLKTQE